MSAEELLHEGETDPTDGELYEVGTEDIDVNVDDSAQPSWSSLTVATLKTALMVRGLQTTGRKAELVARLEASQSGRFLLSFVHDVGCIYLFLFSYCQQYLPHCIENTCHC